MRGFSRLFACAVLLAFTLSGCCTPARRASLHPSTVHNLSSADRRLVLDGCIRPGLSRDAVYVAWGEPDNKVLGGKGHEESETWVYRHRLTLYDPFNSYDFFGPQHGLKGYPSARLWQPGYPAGGISYEGTLLYQPHFRTLHTERIVVFGDSKVDRYKAANGTWSQPSSRPAVRPPSVLASTGQPGRCPSARQVASPVGRRAPAARSAVNLRSTGHLRRSQIAAKPVPRKSPIVAKHAGKDLHSYTLHVSRSGVHAMAKNAHQARPGSHAHRVNHAHRVPAWQLHPRST